MSEAGPGGPSILGPPSASEWIALRADTFRAAHALVASLAWKGEAVTVIEVLRVSEFLLYGEDAS